MRPATDRGTRVTPLHGYGGLAVLGGHVFLAPYGLQDPTSLVAAVLQAVFFLLLILILVGVGTHRVYFVAAVVLIMGATLIRFTADSDALGVQAVADLALVVCGGIVLWTSMRRVLQARTATATLISASVGLYLLAGITCAIAFHAVELIVPGSFTTPTGGEASAADLYYFSFVTLSTLGYGDISPASPFARSLAVLLAVFGQVFLVMLLGRLVSLHLASQARERSSAGSAGGAGS
ncbi:MAG: potassium channel family protein [Planctomycetota bacterium]